ncbi:MAG: tRNA lysidine(34) synthetase TilS [Aggregatilineales bacterium]
MSSQFETRSRTDLATRVLRYCRAHGLFEPGVALIGVSGGVDSLTLLHVLIALRTELNITLHVATLDHGLRGATGAEDADFVRQTAETWAVPVTVGRADVLTLAHDQGIGIEDAARQARYIFFAQVAGVIGARQVVVAHHRDDQAETVLMHLVRGAGLAGLRGMLPITTRNGLRIVRPLLDTPRFAIEAYAAAYGLIARLDATNAEKTYSRNWVRLETLPLLRTLNPSIDAALAHTAELARAEYDALLWALRANLVDWPRQADWRLFKTLPLGLQRFAIHQIAPDWSFDQVETLVDWLAVGKPGESRTLPDARTIQLTFDRIVIESDSDQWIADWPAVPADWAQDKAIAMPLPGIIDLGNGWRLSARPLAIGDVPHWDTPPWNSPLHTALRAPLSASVTIRRWRAGDRFAPNGLGGHTQKLSDTLTNLKVPAVWRKRLPLLTIDDQIAWFVAPSPDGLRARVSESFAWRENTAEGWHFAYERDEQPVPDQDHQ